jgi:1,4-dihydroxy-2-naphthoate octaprenyltransferase
VVIGLPKSAKTAARGIPVFSALVLRVGWELIPVGIAAVAAGYFYTGGPKPYGYLGLGEAFVFVFFGLVATIGTTYVVLERIPDIAWWVGSGAGALACSLLVVNNLRDIPTDRVAGKRTLAVRLGDAKARWLYVALVAASFVVLVPVAVDDRPWVLVALAALAVAVTPIRSVRRGAVGRELIPVLGATGKVQLAYGALVTIGLILSA